MTKLRLLTVVSPPFDGEGTRREGEPIVSMSSPAARADGLAAVELREVVKAFGDVRAVDGVSLDIAEGEFFSMLGPSGSGKTTMLRMIAGFD